MTDNLTIADILDKAADLIEPEGAWTRKTFADQREDGTKCYCAMGAIHVVTDNSEPLTNRARTALLRVIPYGSVVSFNDEMGRTQAEVIAAFREAATKAREQSK